MRTMHALLSALVLIPGVLSAQLTPQTTGTTAEFRAMHAPSADVVWAAGRGGVYAVTTDGGASWRADSVAGAAALFFTGAWAADERNAWLLGTSFDGGLARIYRTADGGASWSVQWESTEAGVFMDALQCWSLDHCVAYGDPIGGALMIVRTTDGRTWNRVAADRMPALIEGEAGFAASGTTLTLAGRARGWIGTGGGSRARVYITEDGGASWAVADTPLPGNSTSGIFGIAFRDSLNGVAAGGDYERRTEEQRNVVRTSDGGRTWRVVGTARPHGVRYGVAYSAVSFTPAAGAAVRPLLGVGPSGVGVSHDDGATWTTLDTTHYNTVTFAPDGDAWVGGPDGRVARIGRAALASAGGAPEEPEYPTRFDESLAQRPAVRDALAWIESGFEDQIAEWIRITEIPGTSRHEQQRGAYVKAQLEAEGLIVTVDSIGNVIARRPGTGGGETVVFAAHMDTVHPLDTDVTVKRDSAEVAGRPARVLRAPGIFDNSASVANMLAMVRALNRADVQTSGDLIFIATTQEELGLLGMEYWLEHNPGVADVLVALDGALPNVNYGALGIYWTRYSFHGEGSHTNTSAGRPHPARALSDAIRDIYTIEIPDYMGGAVYNVGMLDGGKIYNAIPEEVSFTMDLRSVNPILLNDLDAQIDSAVSRAATAHGVEWAKEQTLRNRAGGTAQMLEDRRAHPLIQTAIDVHGHLGIESRAIASGSTDANAGVVRGIPSISIGRAIGGDGHTLSEWSEVDSALPATKIALLIGIAMAGLAVPGT
ncbi:MAG TPA: M20/M25/M40 family metallo-hydrolase [Longimicrobiales bacterium]|nr:M20/M25/M40 family metallo-hydrolase [Longimicrobiales bacterium]